MDETEEEAEQRILQEIGEELLGREIVCTCLDDPDFCEEHGGWGGY